MLRNTNKQIDKLIQVYTTKIPVYFSNQNKLIPLSNGVKLYSVTNLFIIDLPWIFGDENVVSSQSINLFFSQWICKCDTNFDGYDYKN